MTYQDKVIYEYVTSINVKCDQLNLVLQSYSIIHKESCDLILEVKISFSCFY